MDNVIAVQPAVDKYDVTAILIVTENTPKGKITCMSRIDYDVFKDGEQLNDDAINFFEVLMDIIQGDLKLKDADIEILHGKTEFR